MEPLLKVDSLSKRFGSVVANDQVSFEVMKGEIHCLLGENGAGKSTITECIYGFYKPDSGSIYINGVKKEGSTPSDSIRMGIGMVHQHFVLVEPLTVIENVIVGTPDATMILDLDVAEKKLADICEHYDVDLDLRAKIWDLSVGQQQWVEILKMLYLDAKLLILDEPTAVLTPQESEKLFKIIHKMTEEGISIILISHKLKEVMQSDRVTVLRKGKKVGTVNTRETDMQALTNMMVGREVLFKVDKEDIPLGEPVLEIKNISLKHAWGGDALKDVSLTIHKHEIVGIAGVAGNGQKELFEVLVGVRHPDSGQITVNGTDITGLHPKKIMELGVGHIPQDRYNEGLIGDFCISDNLILGKQRSDEFTKGPILNNQKIDDFARKCVADYDIATPSIKTCANNLSGGNAQKIILAREIAQSSTVLLANQPTRGLDVGVIEYVHKQLLEMRKEGYAILMASEELDDLFNLADRIAVIFKGQFLGIFKTEDANIEEIGLLMAGHIKEEKVA